MREQNELEFDRRASLVDEEARHIRSPEMAAGSYSSIPLSNERRTNDCADNDMGTTEGDPSADLVNL